MPDRELTKQHRSGGDSPVFPHGPEHERVPEPLNVCGLDVLSAMIRADSKDKTGSASEKAERILATCFPDPSPKKSKPIAPKRPPRQ